MHPRRNLPLLVILPLLLSVARAQAPASLGNRLFYTTERTATVGARTFNASAYLLEANGHYTELYYGAWDLVRGIGGWQPTATGTYDYTRTSATTAVLRLRAEGGTDRIHHLAFTDERHGTVEPPHAMVRATTFWLGTPGQAAPLLNTAVRAVATRESPVTAGFVIGGTGPRAVLVRAIGPGLSAFGITRALRDPKLTLPRLTAPFHENDNWSETATPVRALTALVGAFPLQENSRDAALLLPQLAPGAYTVQAEPADNSEGEVLIEVYLLP